jgi:hypothetical protein
MVTEEERNQASARLKQLRALLAEPAYLTRAATWAIEAIDAFLVGEAGSLDEAFGFVRDGRKGRSLANAPHAHHAAEMFMRYKMEMAARGDRTETAVCAQLGREFGLGGDDAEHEIDSVIASHFKRILKTYRQPIENEVVALVEAGLEAKDAQIDK